MTLCEVFAREAAMQTQSAIILARIDAFGAVNVAALVAPLWGLAPERALERLSRYRAFLEGRKPTGDMTSAPLFALLSVLGLTVAAK